jgi:multicomponent Na+:H+ antiporter subunit C
MGSLLNFPFLAAVILAGIALYILIFKKNMIKFIMGIALLEASVNLFFVALGYREGGGAPIYTNSPAGVMVLPVPQALVLTSIVIGVSILALMLSMAIRTYRHTGDIDTEKSRRMKG